MKYAFILLTLFGTLVSCSQHTDSKTYETAHTAPGALALNGDERWQADKATNENIAKLQQIMQQHLNQGDKNSLEAVNELGSTMRLGLQAVFDECRMKGPEHDMLHTYLMPVLEDVKMLEASVDLPFAIAARERLSERLALYHTYFK